MKTLFFIFSLLGNSREEFSFLKRKDVQKFEEENYKFIVDSVPSSPLFDESLKRLVEQLIENNKEKIALRYIKSYKGKLKEPYLTKLSLAELKIYKKLNLSKKKEKILKKIFLVMPYLLEPGDVEEIKGEHFRKGKYYLNRGNYKKAMEHFNKEKNQEIPLLFYYKGYISFKEKNYREALLNFSKFSYDRESRWYFEKAKILKGLSYKYLGKRDSALVSFLTVTQEYRDLREMAMKETRNTIAEMGFDNLKIFQDKMHKDEYILLLWTMEKKDDLYKIIENWTDKENLSIFLAFILAKLKNASYWSEYIFKEDPLSFLSVIENNLCTIRENSVLDTAENTFNKKEEDIIITAYFDLYETFHLKLKNFNTLQELEKLSYSLHRLNLPYYGVAVAKKGYALLRKENKTCFKESFIRLLFPIPFEKEVISSAEIFDIDPFLLWAIMRRESLFKPDAVSPKGAIGLMQIIPQTAKEILYSNGENFEKKSIFIPETNIYLGAYHIKTLIDTLGELYLALAAYNAGLEKVKEWISKGIIKNEFQFFYDCPYEETRKYVFRVLSDYEVYKRLYMGIYEK